MTIDDIREAVRAKKIRITDHADEEAAEDQLAGKEKTMELKLNCPHCGGELIERTVEKLLKGGVNTAVVKSQAEVCLHCGERLYAPEAVKLFEKVREKLETDNVSDLKPLGRSFQAA